MKEKNLNSESHTSHIPPHTSNNGITLIALVITIVIMLILVAVTVTASINGGLFGFAKQAKDQTEIAEEKGALNTSVITAMAKSRYGNTLQIEHLETTLNANVGDGKTEVLDNVETIVVKFNTSNRYYEIDSNGNIEGPLEIIFDATPGALDGTGTEEDPFIIMSIEDLVYFSKQVTEGTNNYSGKYVALGKTLDFKSDLSYININTTEYDEYLGGDGTTGLKEQLTNGKGFRPIGESNSFGGIFDGKNYEIKNIYENVETCGGLFGYMRRRK